ncbi:MAG: hypothetical protein Q9159_005788 [Coniocarpon cinnabarinum]
MASTLRPTTVVAATVGTAVTGFLAYAVYFDYKRRNDTEFRKNLNKQKRKTAKAAKAQAEGAANRERREIRALVDEANEEGYPEKAEDKEAYFMEKLTEGETLCSNAETNKKEAALCLFKAQKVYPSPKELMGLYDKTVPKVVLDTLAEMVAYDRTSDHSSSASSSAGVE